MQPSEFDDLDWDEGMDLAERVEERWAKDLEGQIEILVNLFESHAKAVSSASMAAINALAARAR